MKKIYVFQKTDSLIIKIFLIILCFFWSFAAFADVVDNIFQKNDVLKIKNVLKMNNGCIIIVKGHILKQIGEKEFLFSDGTDEIKVKIDDNLWTNFTVTAKTEVILKGKLNKDLHFIKIDTESIEIIE